MRIEQIAYIEEIARLGSINKAARQLLVSQPYLSSLLKSVEEELGVELFCREIRGVTLTEAGKKYLELCRVISNAYADMARLRYTYSQQISDYLSVANIYSFTLLDLFREFSDRYSGSDKMFSYAEMPNSKIMDTVCRGRANLGFMYYAEVQESFFRAELAAKKLGFQPLVSEPFYAVVNDRHPLSGRPGVCIEEMGRYKFVADLPNLDFHRQTFRQWFDNKKVSPMTFDNNRSAFYFLTKADDCFSVGQRSLNLTNPFVTTGQLHYIPLLDSPFPLVTGYVLPEDRPVSPLAREFCAYVRSRLAAKNA